MVVPAGSPSGLTLTNLPPANSTRVPSSSSAARVCRSNRETAAIEGSASPRNPSVAIESKSSAVRSFDVACRSNASSASSCIIPVPSSITRIIRLPPDSTSTRIDCAPASNAFSSSSFTTEAGRSTTSPAAILFATFSASIRIRVIELQVRKPLPYPPLRWGGSPDLLRPNSTNCADTNRPRGSWQGRASARPHCILLLFDYLQLNPQQVQLVGIHIRRRFSHQILGLRGFWEGDHFANRLLAREQRDDAVNAQRDAAVRRRSVGQGVQKKSESVAQLFLAEAQRPKDSLLDVLLMNSNAAGAQFRAIEDEVVALRAHRQAHFIGGVLQFRNIFLDDPGKGMLRADDRLVGPTPFKQRESGDPQEFPAICGDEFQLLRKQKTHLPRNQCGGIRAGELFFGRDGDDQVAGARVGGCGNFFQGFGAEIFFERRRHTFGRDFKCVHAARAQRFCFFGDFVKLFARERGTAGSGERLDASLDVQRFAGGREMFGHVMQFHTETQVWFVGAVSTYRLTIFHAPERSFYRNAR